MNSEELKDVVVDDTPTKQFNYDSVNVTDKQLGMLHSSNIVTGFIGAVIGSLIGVALWVIVYYFGYISTLAGFAIIFCALKGYALLGGMLDKKGVVVVVIVSLVMVFVANYLSIAFVTYMELKDAFQMKFVDVFELVPELLKDEEVHRAYISDLALGYFFTVVGGITMIASAFKKR